MTLDKYMFCWHRELLTQTKRQIHLTSHEHLQRDVKWVIHTKQGQGDVTNSYTKKKILEEPVSPSEDQAEQGADENEDLVEHGWVGPLDCSVDVILPNNDSRL